MNFGFLELDSGYQSPGFHIAQEMISPIPDSTGKNFLESQTGLPYNSYGGQEENEKIPRGSEGGGGGCFHIWVI